MRRSWRRLAGALLVAAAVAYLIREVARNYQQLRAHPWQPDPILLMVSIAAHVLVLAWGVYVWRRLLVGLVAEPPTLMRLQRIWFLSSLARYIPGKIFQFVAVAQLSSGEAAAPPVLVASLVMHTLVSLGTAVLVGTVLLIFVSLGPTSALLSGVVLALGGLVLTHPRVARRGVDLLRLLPARFQLREIQWSGSWPDGLWVLTASLLSWLAYGAVFLLLIGSLTPIDPLAYAQVTAAHALSFVAGILSLLPAGLGVREVALTEMLGPVVPAGVAVMLALVARLWTIAAEVAGGGLAFLLARWFS